MSLGKIFVNSIVREVGRNYGRALSNSLLGDAHALPVRSVGNTNSISRKRGRIYDNKLDELIKKAEIKTPQGSISQVQNMNHAFFDLVREAQADGAIDLDELSYLMRIGAEAQLKMKILVNAIQENGDDKRAALGREKMEEIEGFFQTVYENMTLPDMPDPGSNNYKAFGYLAFGASVITLLATQSVFALGLVVPGFVFLSMHKKKEKKILQFQRVSIAKRLKKILHDYLNADESDRVGFKSPNIQIH